MEAIVKKLLKKSSIVVALFLLICCSEPIKQYAFEDLNPFSGWKKVFPITLELDIPKKSGQLFLCAQFIDNRELNDVEDIPLSITFISPDNEKFYDKVMLPLNVTLREKICNRNGNVVEIEWPYMKIPDTYKKGRWKIILRHAKEHIIYQHIIGIGASFKSTTENE